MFSYSFTVLTTIIDPGRRLGANRKRPTSISNNDLRAASIVRNRRFTRNVCAELFAHVRQCFRSRQSIAGRRCSRRVGFESGVDDWTVVSNRKRVSAFGRRPETVDSGRFENASNIMWRSPVARTNAFFREGFSERNERGVMVLGEMRNERTNYYNLRSFRTERNFFVFRRVIKKKKKRTLNDGGRNRNALVSTNI